MLGPICCPIFIPWSISVYEALALYMLAWTISNMLNGKAHKSGENPEPCPAGGSGMDGSGGGCGAGSGSGQSGRKPTACVKIDISTCQSNHPMNVVMGTEEHRPTGGGAGGGLLVVPTHHNLQLDKISVRSISSEDISSGGNGKCCSAAARNPAIKTGRRLQLMQVSCFWVQGCWLLEERKGAKRHTYLEQHKLAEAHAS